MPSRLHILHIREWANVWLIATVQEKPHLQIDQAWSPSSGTSSILSSGEWINAFYLDVRILTFHMTLLYFPTSTAFLCRMYAWWSFNPWRGWCSWHGRGDLHTERVGGHIEWKATLGNVMILHHAQYTHPKRKYVISEMTNGTIDTRWSLPFHSQWVINIKFPLQPHQKYYITQYKGVGIS